MSATKEKDAAQSHWHKCPNILTDKLVGQHISPNAAWIVLNIWRLTEGMGGRKSAPIPTERFMSLLGIKKKETAYKFVQEAVHSGLITVKKQRGMVNIYAINMACPLWFIDEVGAEIVPTNNGGSTENGDYLVPKMGTRVVPIIGTGVVPKMGTLIKKEESIKETSKEQDESNPFDKTYEVIKNHLKAAGIIPVNKPVIDDQLKPDVYTFVAWFNEKGMSDSQLARQAVQWFRKKEPDELKSYYTPANEMNGRYFNPDDYPKTIPMTDEEAAAIKAKYADVMRELRF